MQQRPNEAHLKKCFTNYLNDNEIHLSSQEAIIFHTQKALLDASHPRHRSSLQMLRAILARDRNNTEFKEKTSADHTLAAIHKMQGLGISSKTISKIIESLYDIRLNYHNSMAKIQGLGRVKFDEIIFAESLLTEEKLMIDRRTHQTNIQQNIEQNTGGECSQLAITYREIFRHKKIASLIRKDIGEKLINIHIVGGHDRTYFTKPNAVHIFCRLIIDDTMFYIDPALGEINISEEGGYINTGIVLEEARLHNTDQIYQDKTRAVTMFKTNDTTITPATQGNVYRTDSNNSGLFMGMFNKSENMFRVSYAEIEKSGQKYPCIYLKTPKEKPIIGILTHEKKVRLNTNEVPPALKEEIKQHLLALDAITDYS